MFNLKLLACSDGLSQPVCLRWFPWMLLIYVVCVYCRYIVQHMLGHPYFQLLVDMHCKQRKLNVKITEVFLNGKKVSD